MERLTERHCGVAVIKNKSKLKEAMEKLAAYEEAEERRINPGDNVYTVDPDENAVTEYCVSKISYGKFHDTLHFVGGNIFTVWGKKWEEYLDKYLFKNKEEAEQALARMEKNNGKHEN